MPPFVIAPLLEEQLAQCTLAVRAGFASVAQQFQLTAETCPTHGAFDSEESLRRRFHTSECFVALREGEIIGFVSLAKTGRRTYEINRLTVLPQYRHLGCGRALCLFVLQRAKALGAKCVTLDFIVENEPLRPWYEALGFVYTGCKKFAHLPFTSGYMEHTLQTLPD